MLKSCVLQTLLVGASAGTGGPRARKLQRLKSSFRSNSGSTRLSTVQLIQQIQVPLPLPCVLPLKEGSLKPKWVLSLAV